MSRISPGTILLGILAVLFGLLGAYVVRTKLQKEPPREERIAAEPPRPVVVPMASRELKAGRQITLTDISIYRFTPEQLKKQDINKVFMSNTQQIIGQVIRRDVKAGETFDTSMFYLEGTGPSVADLLEPGKRAVTVRVETIDAVSGFAAPGSWVDVYFRSETNKDPLHDEMTVLLLERVKVLAVDEQTFEGTRNMAGGARSNRSASVTLSVSPDQAASLRVVEGRGGLSLSLRNPEDMEFVAGPGPQTLYELLKIPPVNRHKMVIYRGNTSQSVEFAEGERVNESTPRYAAGHSPERTFKTPVGSPTTPTKIETKTTTISTSLAPVSGE